MNLKKLILIVALVLGIGVVSWSVEKSPSPEKPQMEVPAAYVVDKLQQELVGGHLSEDGNIDIAVKGDAIILSGILADEETIRFVVWQARLKAGKYRVVNQLRVGAVEKDKLFVNSQLQTQLVPRPTKIPTSFMEGTVYDAHSKKVLSEVEIWCQSLENDSFGQITTDAQGHYHLSVDSGADYVLSVSADSYSPRLYENVSVTASGLKQDVFLRRRPVVKGVVRDAAGRPLSGAKLYLWNQDETFDSTDQVQSDRNGAFRSENLAVPFASGRVKLNVTAVHPRFSYVQKSVVARARDAASDEVTLNFQMPALATVSGRITSGGKPLNGAYLVANFSDGSGPFDYDMNAEQRGNFFTDADGRYRFQVSAPHRYKFGIAADDMSWQEVEIALWPGQNATINRDLKPFPYGTIAGRVTDLQGHPVFNAGIELWTRGTSETNPVAYTDKKGFYRYNKVAPRDDYDVVAYMPQSQMRTGPRKIRCAFARIRLCA